LKSATMGGITADVPVVEASTEAMQEPVTIRLPRRLPVSPAASLPTPHVVHEGSGK
jgi:hypothetical protein